MTLYRTHRPHLFSELIGQEAAVRTLQQALIKQRVAQAYLFSGPRGTGKTSTARIFAQAICCEHATTKSNTYEPCGICESCRLISEGKTTDFLELDAASNRSIEDIREIREQTSYPPVHLSRKIYLIDEVHMLTGEAFNALLKTLEEPPKHCLFILATTEPHKVPVTIRSRCQLVRFERGTPKSIATKLSRIITKEELDVEAGVAELIATHADGGYRDAETVLESLTTRYSPLSLTETLTALGVTSEKAIKSLLDALLKQDKDTTVDVLKKEFINRSVPVDRVIFQLLSHLQDLLLANPNPILTTATKLLLEAYILQKSAPLPWLSLEIACLSICDYSIKVDGRCIDKVSSREINQIVATPSRTLVVQAKSLSPEVAPVVPVVELREAEGPLPDMRKAWKNMAEEVCRENMVLGQSIKDTVFHTASNGVITVRVRFSFHADKLNEKKNRQMITAILEGLSGRTWQIVYEINGVAPRRQAAASLPDISSVFGTPNS